MSKTLTDIAQTLKNSSKKVQLIYAFNGTGKTRLSREFKQLIDAHDKDEEKEDEERPIKILYYNAFTEDLFYWDNGSRTGRPPKLKIQPNSFTEWILLDQGQDQNIINNFQLYTADKLTPKFNDTYKDHEIHDTFIRQSTVQAFSEVTFSLERGDDESVSHLKISKGEESNFIWSVFYTLLDQIISVLNEPEPENRETNQFYQLEYIFIDDPVSSLDENHLIQLAVNLASLIKSAPEPLKFIITTHNPLFYNVLCNELKNNDSITGYRGGNLKKYRLEKLENGMFQLEKQPKDSPFSYHLFLLSELQKAISSGQISKYHFNFLRNILEKTATFLGYNHWTQLLPKTVEGRSDPYANRILNLSSHSEHSSEEIAIVSDDDKRVLGYLVKHLIENYRYNHQGQ